MALQNWFAVSAYVHETSGDELEAVQNEIKDKLVDIQWRSEQHVWDDNINTTFKYEGENDIHLFDLTHTKQLITKHVEKYCSWFNNYPVELHSSWFNFSQKGDFQFQHDHVTAVDGDIVSQISGVYYYQTNGEDGDIVFINPFTEARYFDFGRVSSNAVNIYNPTVGGLLLFPSFLQHKVRPNNTDSTRISLAFNFTRK